MRIAALAALAALSACTGEEFGCGMGAACPSLADVSGARYAVSVDVDLVGAEGMLTPFAPITRSNVGERFAETTAYRIEGVDPSVLLIVPSRIEGQSTGAYRELWSLAEDPFPVAYCAFVPPARKTAYEDCR